MCAELRLRSRKRFTRGFSSSPFREAQNSPKLIAFCLQTACIRAGCTARADRPRNTSPRAPCASVGRVEPVHRVLSSRAGCAHPRALWRAILHTARPFLYALHNSSTSTHFEYKLPSPFLVLFRFRSGMVRFTPLALSSRTLSTLRMSSACRSSPASAEYLQPLWSLRHSPSSRVPRS